MKKLLAIICLMVFATSASAVTDLTGWNWQRPIDVSTSSGFVRLAMTPEIFNQSQTTLHDLRVIDKSDRLVPHVIHWGRVQEMRQLEWIPARLINATFVPGKYAAVVADFGEATEKSHVRITLSGQNYRRRALIEGSNDTKAWERVAEDLWLFDVSLPGQNFKVDTVKVPTNQFRYLRLTVYHMTDDPRRITIDTIKSGFLRAEMEKELVLVPVKQRVVSHDEKNRQTILDLDLGFRNLPVANLQFDIMTPYFYRGYELFGRNQSKEKIPRKTETRWDTIEQDVPWRPLHRGVLYRIRHKQKIDQSLKVEGVNTPYRYLQLRIFDEDNPPLKIGEVSIYRRDTHLIFQAQPGQGYTLIGGNPKAGEANYDLTKSIQGLEDLTLPRVSLGPLTAIPHKEKIPPWTERHSILLWIILILAVGTMVILIARNLKKLPSLGQRP